MADRLSLPSDGWCGRSSQRLSDGCSGETVSSLPIMFQHTYYSPTDQGLTSNGSRAMAKSLQAMQSLTKRPCSTSQAVRVLASQGTHITVQSDSWQSVPAQTVTDNSCGTALVGSSQGRCDDCDLIRTKQHEAATLRPIRTPQLACLSLREPLFRQCLNWY